MEYHLELNKKEMFIGGVTSFLAMWSSWLIAIIVSLGLTFNRPNMSLSQALTDPNIIISILLKLVVFLVMFCVFSGLRSALSSNIWHAQPVKISINDNNINVTYNGNSKNLTPEEISGFIRNPFCWTLYFFKSPVMFLPKRKFSNDEWVSLSNKLNMFRKKHLTNRSKRTPQSGAS